MADKEKQVTLQDVAELAGVCRSAAGKVLIGTGGSIRVGAQARQRILDAAKKLGYRRNMAGAILAGGNSRLIGVILDSHTHYRDMRLLIELEDLCARNGYQLQTCFSHDNPRQIARSYSMLKSYGANSVICCAHDYPGMLKEIEEIFAGEDRVIFLEKPEFEVKKYVATTRKKALHNMIAAAVKSGYRRFGLVCGSPIWATERQLHQEFSLALESCGIEADERLLFHYEEKPDIAECCGDAMRGMILPQKPDFLFVHDAVHAVYLRNLIHNAGLEITLHGGDDDPIFAGFQPATGSLDPCYKKTAELLFETASGKRTKCRETIEIQFRKNSIIRKN